MILSRMYGKLSPKILCSFDSDKGSFVGIGEKNSSNFDRKIEYNSVAFFLLDIRNRAASSSINTALH